MTQLIADFKINRCELIDNNSGVESDTRDLRFLERKTTGQRFEFRIRSVELEEREIKRVLAWFGGIRRRSDTIEVFLPGYSESDAGAIAVSGSYVAGDFEIALANVTGVQVGDFLTFAGHDKAYQVEEIAATTISIVPNLMRPVANAEIANFGSVQFTAKPRGRVQRFTVDADRNTAQIELDIVEVWA